MISELLHLGEELDYDALPRRDIYMDWDEFKRLPREEKHFFIEMAESMERGRWFGRNGRDRVIDWACVDLSEYADYDAFAKRLKQEGSSFYEGRKAEKRGYYSKFFDKQTFISDIVAIDTSARERQGKPMSDSSNRPVEDRGGYSPEIRPPEIPAHNVFWHRMFGTFRARLGHRQGPLAVDEQLVSYLAIRRFGNFANYNLLLGHKDFIRDGIVHKMNLDFVKALLDTRNQAIAGTCRVDVSLLGIRYIGYGSLWGTTPGLRRWKKSNLFTPGITCFDYTPALADSALTISSRSLTADDSALALTVSLNSLAVGEAISVSWNIPNAVSGHWYWIGLFKKEEPFTANSLHNAGSVWAYTYSRTKTGGTPAPRSGTWSVNIPSTLLAGTYVFALFGNSSFENPLITSPGISVLPNRSVP